MPLPRALARWHPAPRGQPAQTSAPPHRAPRGAASPTAGRGSGCTQHWQLWGKVQAKAPQTPQGLTGCAKHCPYPTLSPHGHGFCSQISVVSTPGYSKLPFWLGFSWFCWQSCALLPAQCPAGHPGVSLASRRAGATSRGFHPHVPSPKVCSRLYAKQKKTGAGCTGFLGVTRMGLGQLMGPAKHSLNFLLKQSKWETPTVGARPCPCPPRPLKPPTTRCTGDAFCPSLHAVALLLSSRQAPNTFCPGCSNPLGAHMGLFTPSFPCL